MDAAGRPPSEVLGLRDPPAPLDPHADDDDYADDGVGPMTKRLGRLPLLLTRPRQSFPAGKFESDRESD